MSEFGKKVRALEEAAKCAFEGVESVSCTPHFLNIVFGTQEAAKFVQMRVPLSVRCGKSVSFCRDALENRVPDRDPGPKSWFGALWDAAPWFGLVSSALTIAFYSAELLQ